MTVAEIGSIFGPRVRTTRPRINFWHGIDEEASWESMWELVQQRQRWVRAHYGDAAFEDKPLMDGYTKFDLTDGGMSLQSDEPGAPSYQELLPQRDWQKIGFVLNQQVAEHDEHHFVRLRPFCPTCRGGDIGGKVLASLSFASWLIRFPGRMPKEASDTEIGWDTDQVVETIASDQAELYMDLDDIGSLRPPRDLIEGIIPTRGVGYITGRDRSLKTFLALDICLHVAFMMPYWHRGGVNNEARDRRKVGFNNEGKIIFAAGEGVHSFNPRIQAWIQAQHVKSYGDPGIRTVDDEPSIRKDGCPKCEAEADPHVGHVGHLEFAEPENLENTKIVLAPGYGELERKNISIRRGTPNLFAGGEDYRFLLARARRERPDVIVLDTLALSSGGADQQAAKDMGLIHDRAAMLAEASGGVVIIIAHTDKGDNDARGSSVIEDNSDFVIHCDRKDNDHVEVTVAKRKDADDNWRFHLGVSIVEIDMFGQSSLILKDFDGELEGYVDPDAEKVAQMERDMENLVMRIKHNRFDAIQAAASIDSKLSPKTVGRKLDQLVAEGVLLRHDGGKGRANKTFWYFPADRMAHWDLMGHEVTPHDQPAP